MAKFFKTSAGKVGMRRSADEESRIPVPGDATNVVEFDEETNAGHLADFSADSTRFAYVSGTLQKDGIAFAPTADGSFKSDLGALLSGAAAAISNNDTFLAIPSPNNAQNAAQIRALTQQNNRIIRRLVQLARLRG